MLEFRLSMVRSTTCQTLHKEALGRALYSQLRDKEALNKTFLEGTGCVRKSTNSWFCNSQWFSQFAAFLIVTRADISIADGLSMISSYDNMDVSNDPSVGSPTDTLLPLMLTLNNKVN